MYSIFFVAVILSCRLWWFWERSVLAWDRALLIWERSVLCWDRPFLKRCFSVNANSLQGIWKSGFAVGKGSNTVGKFDKTVAHTSKSHIFHSEKCDFLSLKVTLFVCLATELIVFITIIIVLYKYKILPVKFCGDISKYFHEKNSFSTSSSDEKSCFYSKKRHLILIETYQSFSYRSRWVKAIA